MRKTKIIGITGPSGSGKSSARVFITNTVPNSAGVNVDMYAFQALHQEKELLTKLYGNRIFDGNGLINSDLFASAPEKIEIVNRATFPYITNQVVNKIERFNYKDLIVLDWFLLPIVEDLWKLCDQTVAVFPNDFKTRYLKMVKRDGGVERASCDRMLDYHAIGCDVEINNAYNKKFFREIHEKVLDNRPDIDIRGF